jgi:methyl-accepting chemotaxis protein
LIVALSRVPELKGLAAIKQIGAQNAIALSSTVVALILRTSWNLGHFPSETEEGKTEKLNAAYEKLAATLERTSEMINRSAEEIGGTDGQFANSFNAVFDVNTRFQGSITRVNNKLKSLGDTGSGLLAEEIAKVATPTLEKMDETNKQLKAVSDALATTIHRLNTLVESRARSSSDD